MKFNFCTLFNINYLTRGLALYQSLQEQAIDFHLYVYAFDKETQSILKKLNYSNLTVIGLEEFEDEDLLQAKKTRGFGEYCWTCTPATILHSITKYNLPQCTYIDADLYFFDSPSTLYIEMGDNSVLITPHNFSPEYMDKLIAGKYCVQFMPFKNNEEGLTVLKWWRNACIEWCYNRFEDGKFGDQKYLDTWTDQFKGVYELKNKFAGVAPWNAQQYTSYLNGDKIFLEEKATKSQGRLIFYHFHDFKPIEYRFNFKKFTLFKYTKLNYGEYQLIDSHKNLIYKRYREVVKKFEKLINQLYPNYDVKGKVIKTRNLENLINRK